MLPMLEDLCLSLNRDVAAVEKSVGRRADCDVYDVTDQSSTCRSAVDRPSVDDSRLSCGGSQQGVTAGRSSTSSAVVRQASPSSSPLLSVPVPVSLCDVGPEVVASGAAIYLGCLDSSGAPVVAVCLRHPAWQTQAFNIDDVARLILYFHSLRNDVIRSKGLTLIADVRGTTTPVINSLLQTLLVVQASSVRDVINIVHVLADRQTKSFLLRSPAFCPQNNLRIDLLMSSDAMFRFIERRFLPLELGGQQNYRHSLASWISFRQCFESFLAQCCSGARILLRTSRLIASLSSASLPVTSAELLQAIDRYEEQVNSVINDPDVLGVADGTTALRLVADAGSRLVDDHDDVREALEGANRFHGLLIVARDRLLALSDVRLNQLKTFLRVRELESAANKVVESLQSQYVEIQTKFQFKSQDNVQCLTTWRQEFEHFHRNTLAEITKGYEMVEKMRQLMAVDEFSFVNDVLVRIADDLKVRIDEFTEKLEQVRKKIESILQCYELMNQMYRWAVEAIRFIAGVRPSNDSTVDSLDCLLLSIDCYLRDHPAISSEAIQSAVEQCRLMNNNQLAEQCETARAKCDEAMELISARQNMLLKMRENLQGDKNRQMANAALYGNGVILRPHRSAKFGPPSVSCSALEDHLACLRRRSYAGKPSTPVYGAMAAAFKNRFVDIQEYEEYLLGEGLITDNMSERIVASLPKCLSDSTMRGSRDSLRSSRESVRSSQESLLPSTSCESLAAQMAEARGSAQQGCGTASAGNHASHWKLFKRAVGRLIEGSDGTSNHRLTGVPSTSSLCCERSDSQADDDISISPGRQSTVSWSTGSAVSQFSFDSCRESGPVPAVPPTAEEIARKHRSLSLIVQEMVQTERDYIAALRFIINNYIPEMSRDDVVQPLRGKRGVIFGNLEKIYEFHSHSFLQELEACQDHPLRVVDAFLRHTSDFYLYALYSKNKPKSDCLMAECGTAFFRKKQQELGDKLDLNSYLLKPIQRMAKYSLLLELIMKECPSAASADCDVRGALEMVRFQMRHGNDLLAMDCIRDCDVNLCEQGMLLRQDEFVVWQGRKRSIRHVFLFEEMVLFSKTKRKTSGNDCYTYKSSIKTSDIGLTENIGDSNGNERKFELWFRRRAPGVTYTLQAASLETKRAWVTDVSCLLWQQAIRNRERRRSEQAPVGSDVTSSTGSVCLRNRPSSGHLIGGVPRIRNSIAVSSYEHLRSGSKRTYSLASIDSCSSGSGTVAGQSSSKVPSEMRTEGSGDPARSDVVSPGITTCVPFQRLALTSISSVGFHEDVSTQTTLRRSSPKVLNCRTADDIYPRFNDRGYIGEDGVPCSNV